MTAQTETSPNKQQVALKIQQGIRQTEDDLVGWIEAALNQKSSYGNLEESQFRNLVRVADTTESAEVIKNFLRYQVGRDKKWGQGKDSLAEKIITDIGDYKAGKGHLVERAKKIANTVEVTDDIQIKAIWLNLIRLYLGYGSRHLKYLRAQEENNNRR